MEDLASLKIGARDVHMVKEQHTRVNRSLQKELTNDMLCVTINIGDRERIKHRYSTTNSRCRCPDVEQSDEGAADIVEPNHWHLVAKLSRALREDMENCPK